MAEVKTRKPLPVITGGFMNLTQACNLACPYCFVCQQPKSITYQVAEDAAKFFAKNAMRAGKRPSINFFGGEPMIMYESIIKPLTEWIRDTYGDAYELSLTTNGTLLTREVMEFFNANNVGMLFSIDGDKKTQDINRPYHDGKGSFDDLEKIIDMVLEYHPNMTFRATINQPTHKYLYENYRFAVEKGYTNSFFIPNIFNEWSYEELAELEQGLVKIKDYYIEELRAGRQPMSFNHFDRAKADLIRIAKLKDDDYRENKRLLAGGTCGLGAGSFASVGVTGNLYSCQEMVENPDVGDRFKVGNIYDGVDDEKRYQIAESFNPVNVVCSKADYCEDCPKKRICDGGCTINNFFKADDLHTVDFVYCWWERKCMEMALEIIETCTAEKLTWGADMKFNECKDERSDVNELK